MTTIYIRLLDEGSVAFRPTPAEPVKGGLFKVLPTSDYNPNDEKWEFLPGSIVKGEEQNLSGGRVLVAVKAHYDAPPK